MKTLVILLLLVGAVSCINFRGRTTWLGDNMKENPMYNVGYRRGYQDAKAEMKVNVMEVSRDSGNPYRRECYVSWSNCIACRDYFDSCCSDKNCKYGLSCKPGFSSNVCDM